MPLMSECRSTVFSLTNYESFPFTLPETHQSLMTNDLGDAKYVTFCCTGKDVEIRYEALKIIVYNNG